MNAIQKRLQVMFSRGVIRCSLVSALVLLVSTTTLAGAIVGRVVAVTDGDTIKVLDATNVQHVVWPV